MSSPFSKISPNGQPSWTAVSANNGNFSPVNVSGGMSVPEVGYDEGGYGQGGYDAPAILIPSAVSTQWSIFATK